MSGLDKNLLLITTGGTIDKAYGTGKGITDLHIDEPAAPDILRQLGPSEMWFTHRKLFQKDSLEFTDFDRMAIMSACADMYRKILITHGTDTLVETAKVIEAYLDEEYLAGKTIVLTGALKPACMINSDAEFNLGAALLACNTLPPGIYIAMHGDIFAPGECEKFEDGYFRHRKTKVAA